MCNEDEQSENNNEKDLENLSEDERIKYEEWLEMVQEIRMKIDL